MFYLILGGSGSGKSEYAENLVLSLSKEEPRIYLATMQVYGEEGKKRVERHRKLREHKNFYTVEQTRNIADCAITWKPDMTVLLECMSNLTANEMFLEDDIESEDAVVEKIVHDVLEVKKKIKNLVVVSNNVFEDGIRYDETTMAYLRALGRINTLLAGEADVVTEVVYTIPVPWKEAKETCL